MAAAGTTSDGKPEQVMALFDKKGVQNAPARPVVAWELTAEEKMQLQDLLVKILADVFEDKGKFTKADFDELCNLQLSVVQEASKQLVMEKNGEGRPEER